MELLHPLVTADANYVTTRETVQRVAVHVLARRRAALCGKFGLRATPGGIGTPACGRDHEVVRLSGTRLIRELTGPSASTTSLELDRATLAEAAQLVGVDLAEPFAAGHDTPPLGDPHEPLSLDRDATRALFAWFEFGWVLLDTTLATLPAGAEPSVVQLWPEHFDVGCDVAASPEHRVNLGASPGDSFREEPYLYVGPWDDVRPGDESYWNAPFGAVLAHSDLASAPDPLQLGYEFLHRGVSLLRASDAADGDVPIV